MPWAMAVPDLSSTLVRAKAAGAQVLWGRYTESGLRSAIVESPAATPANSARAPLLAAAPLPLPRPDAPAGAGWLSARQRWGTD